MVDDGCMEEEYDTCDGPEDIVVDVIEECEVPVSG